MGFWRALFGFDLVDPTDGRGPAFAVDVDSIDPAVFGLESWSTTTAPAPRIDRRSAIQVPAVKRARDMIAGTLGGLPLDLIGPGKVAVASVLFEQPEKGVPRSVTMSRLYEDLLFEAEAYWEITEFGWHGYPVHVKRHKPRTIDASRLKQEGKVYANGKLIREDHLIRFESPNDGVLKAGARAIRTCLQLAAAAALHSDGTPPLDWFELRDPDDDPPEEDEIAEFLAKWREYRRANTTGFIPPEFVYNGGVGKSARDLQMAEARQHAVLEIARAAGVDPEDLGVSTTSRTYANREQRLLDLKTFTLGPYVDAVQDRLTMGDVTPRGYIARTRFDGFLRTDTKSRYEAYKLGVEVGALGTDEPRELEDKPPLRDNQKSVVSAAPSPAAVPAHRQPLALPPGASAMSQLAPAAAFDFQPLDPITFAAAVEEAELRLDAPMDGASFEVDRERRVIRGRIVPYGVPAKSKGMWWQFAKGTLCYSDVTRVKLLIQHVFADAVGYAFELDDRDDGMYGAFKVARGKKGDKALRLAEDKVLDGFSIGLAEGGRYERRRIADGREVNFALEAPLQETSLTPAPSFDDSRVQSVAASATQEGTTMTATDTDTEAVAPDVAAADAAPDFAAMAANVEQLTQLLSNPQGISPREASPEAATFTVTDEPAAYRFDGIPGAHDFSTDLIAFGRDHDGEAGERVMAFLTDAFAPRFDVDSADVATVNRPVTRPEMYVDERKFRTPVYNALYSGAISDMTPFIVPKFSSASGLVAAHVEGTEPTPGTFVATSQTVTPSALSGKVEITREVWDQGGNPQVSGLIWNKMVYNYFQSLETAAAAVLTAAAGSITDLALTTNAVDDDLVNELEAHLAGLQFVAGGELLEIALTHQDLYKRLAAAVDSTGRKLLPQFGPTNANGQSRKRFASLDVAGYEFMPAKSLGAAGAVSTNSWLLDPQAVHIWNSAPQRLEFQYRVAYIDLAVWGYVASAVTDTAGVRQITYDPTT